MSYAQISEHLKNNLKEVYRQALDADAWLEEITKQGLGHHDAILTDKAGFRCEEKRFMPYVQELGSDIEALSGTEQENFEASVAAILKKLQVLHTTLAKFKLAMKPGCEDKA